MTRARHIIHLLNEILFEAGESPGRMELRRQKKIWGLGKNFVFGRNSEYPVYHT
jgi:hypothetical protein